MNYRIMAVGEISDKKKTGCVLFDDLLDVAPKFAFDRYRSVAKAFYNPYSIGTRILLLMPTIKPSHVPDTAEVWSIRYTVVVNNDPWEDIPDEDIKYLASGPMTPDI